ncbi:hypothetical protein OB919_03870 [Halobacteria archaeon AArc-curdl1]|uniref:Uncharacterized protein n=1 Tax=Natronosalvus hydrolyticus TaxID=2979988 RepID=A0AAP2Z5N1_9EURY|nr:hypothetical protein [Halobacteria archaeon AArc-curdl1]
MGGDSMDKRGGQTYRDEISVDKHLEAEDGDRVDVHLQLESDAPEPRTVVLTEQLPAVEPSVDVEFHDRTDAWSAEGSTLTFEGAIGPTETIETRYSLQTDAPEAVERAGTESIIVEVLPTDAERSTDPDATVRTVGRIRIEFVENGSTADRRALLDGLGSMCTILSTTGDADEERAPEEGVIETVIATTDDLEGVAASLEDLTYVRTAAVLDVPDGEVTDSGVGAKWLQEDGELAGPEDELSFEETVAYGGATTSDNMQETQPETTESTETQPKTVPEAVEPPETQPAVDEATPESTEGGTLEQLLAELESESIDDDQRDRLRSALGMDTPRSQVVRLTHLETQVQKLVAYADSMEAFIDESGTAQDLIKQVETAREALETLEEHLAQLETDVEERFGALENEFEERHAALEAEVEQRHATFETEVKERHDALEEQVGQRQAQFEARIDEIEGRFETLEDEHESVETTQQSLAAQVEDHDAVIEKLSEVFRPAE